MLIIEIIIGIVLGVFLTHWLKTLPHKRRVKRSKRTLLHLNNYQLMRAATEGYDYLFSMTNRSLFIQLSFCKDEGERDRLAAMLADDVADRWDKTRTGTGPELKPLITEQDKELLRAIGEEIHRIGQTDRAMNAVQAMEDEGVTEEDKERTLRIFREQQTKGAERLDELVQKVAPGFNHARNCP